eukprot:scaffold16597_cov49-Attheya_sp.AAC.5
MKLASSIKSIFLLCLHLGGTLLDIAEACSCIQQILAQMFDNADSVFHGIIKNIPLCEEPCNQNLQVTTTGSNGSRLCGLRRWNKEEEWSIFSQDDFAGSCGGSIQSDPTTRINNVQGLSKAASTDKSFSACIVSGTCDSKNNLCCSGKCRTKKGKCARSRNVSISLHHDG